MFGLIIAVSLIALVSEEYPLYEMEEIVVTATRIETPLANLTTTIDVITYDMIIRNNAKTVAEAIENALGVTEVAQRGTRGSERGVRIRSGGDASKQVLVMIDGQPINDVALGTADLDEMPIDNVARIEIVRGPISALYGANALGGIVNIITERASEGTPATSFHVSGGTFGTQNYSLKVGIKKNRTSAIFTFGENNCDGWRENSDYLGNDFSIKWGYDFKDYGEMDLRLIYHKSEFGVPGMNTTPIENYDGETETKAQSPDARQKREKEYVQIGYKNVIGRNILKVRTYGSFNNKRYECPTAGTDDLSKGYTYGMEVEVNTAYGFLFGGDIHQDEFIRKDLTIFPSERTIDEYTLNQAIFLQKILSIGPTMIVSGIRYDHHSIFGGEVCPRISFVYHLLENLKLSANIGRAFRSPTFEDLYSPYSNWPASAWGPAGDTKGNTDLKPEKAWGYDIGFGYRIRSILSGQVTVFKNDVKNLIRWAEVDPDPDYDKWRPSNVGKSYNQGIEAKITHQIFRDMSHGIVYNYLESKGKKEGQRDYKTLMYTSPHRLNYWINYKNKLGFGINITVNFTEKVEWEDNYGSIHTLPSYTLVNTRVSQRIYRADIFFAAKNIFDKRYQSREYYPLPGRQLEGGIVLKF